MCGGSGANVAASGLPQFRPAGHRTEAAQASPRSAHASHAEACPGVRLGTPSGYLGGTLCRLRTRRRRSRPRARRRPTPTGCCGSGRRVPTLPRRAPLTAPCSAPCAPATSRSAPCTRLRPSILCAPVRPLCRPTPLCRPSTPVAPCSCSSNPYPYPYPYPDPDPNPNPNPNQVSLAWVSGSRRSSSRCASSIATCSAATGA